MLGLLFVAALLLSCGKSPAPEVKKMSASPKSIFETATDKDYFLGKSFDGLSMEMIDDPQANLVKIGGPRHWDPLRWPECVLVVGWKTSYPKVSLFEPYSHGHVLALNRESGDLFVTKAWDIHKMLLPEKYEAADAEPTPVAPSASANRDFVMLPKRLAEVPPSVLEIRFLTGGDLVGPVLVQTGLAKRKWQDQPQWRALRVPPKPAELADSTFEKRPGPTGLRGPGAELRAEAENLTWHGRKVRWPLLGTIQIAEASVAPGVQWIDAHLVFAYYGSTSVQRHSLRIPLAAFEKTGELLKGQFILDMHPVFQEREGEDAWVPRNLKVLVVCANQFFGPYPVDMSGFAVPAGQQGY